MSPCDVMVCSHIPAWQCCLIVWPARLLDSSPEAQILLRQLSPKLPRGVSRGHKPSRHVEMFATKSVTSRRQTHLCRTYAIYNDWEKSDANHKSQRHVLCRGLSWFVSAISRGLCRKVGVMEFGLNWLSKRSPLYGHDGDLESQPIVLS